MSQASRTPLLDTIQVPADLRRLPKTALKQVADELRTETIDAVSLTGGHLGAGLGVVELTVALALRVRYAARPGHLGCRPSGLSAQDPYGPPRSHPHASADGGLSGFTQRARASSTRSAPPIRPPRSRPASAWPWRATSTARHHKVIAVIGDGAMSAGMAYEAMNNAGALRAPDRDPQRQRHVDRAAVGAMSAYLPAHLRRHLPDVARHREAARQPPARAPGAAYAAPRRRPPGRPAARCSRSWASYYVGPIDGHNLDHCCPSSRTCGMPGAARCWFTSSPRRARATRRPRTPTSIHGVARFDVVTGDAGETKANRPPTPGVSARA